MATRLTVRQRFARKMPRVVKFGRQWLRVAASGKRPDTRFVFVVGSQRSGTRLPVQALDYAPQVMTYTEGAAPFFDRVLLVPLDRVDALRRRSIFPIIALKPICETHRISELVERFPGSCAVWIFRDYREAVASASVKWRSGREALRRLASGELALAGWRAGGLSRNQLRLVRELYHDQMTLDEANAVMWYLRNSLFFDLGACKRADIMLVRYRDFTDDPHESLGRMFRFIDVPLPSNVGRAVRNTRSPQAPAIQISHEIERLCNELHERLIAFHQRAKLDRHPTYAAETGMSAT